MRTTDRFVNKMLCVFYIIINLCSIVYATDSYSTFLPEENGASYDFTFPVEARENRGLDIIMEERNENYTTENVSCRNGTGHPFLITFTNDKYYERFDKEWVRHITIKIKKVTREMNGRWECEALKSPPTPPLHQIISFNLQVQIDTEVKAEKTVSFWLLIVGSLMFLLFVVMITLLCKEPENSA